MTKQKYDTLYDAIFHVQQTAPSIGKSADNPFFKSKYADLPAIWDAIKPILGDAGLFISHTMHTVDGQDFIKTKIIHVASKDALESKSKIMLQKSTAQEYGSYITYMRRYAVTAMLGLVTDEDDDGNKATEAQKKQPPKVAKPAKSPLEETASRIAKQLKDAQTPEIVDYVWNGFAKDMAEIKEASPDKAYPALEKLYGERLAATAQAPVDTDEIPH